MALVDKKTQRERIEIPHEPGEWIELTPLTFGDKRALAELKGVESVTYLVRATVAAWSYKVPPSPENIDLLDAETSDWIAQIVAEKVARDPKAQKPEPPSVP